LKNKTMNYFEQVLDPAHFVRTHRSYILNVQQVTRIDPYEKDQSSLRPSVRGTGTREQIGLCEVEGGVGALICRLRRPMADRISPNSLFPSLGSIGVNSSLVLPVLYRPQIISALM